MKCKLLFIVLTCCLSLWAVAQDAGNQIAPENVEMADLFRSDGKIYVVVGVVGIILAGLFLYLIKIERNIRKLEKDN